MKGGGGVKNSKNHAYIVCERSLKEPICHHFFGHFAIFTILLDNNLGYVWTQHLVGTPREALELILSHSEHLMISAPHLLKIDPTNFK